MLRSSSRSNWFKLLALDLPTPETMLRSSSLSNWFKLLALCFIAGATVFVVAVIGVFLLPPHGESDAAFYSILVVAVIAGTAAWSWAETFLSKAENRSAIELPFMVQSSLNPVWAMAAGATIMLSSSAASAQTNSASRVVTERQVRFSPTSNVLTERETSFSPVSGVIRDRQIAFH